jgi:WhiB family redox-sensing transcriptional regulator
LKEVTPLQRTIRSPLDLQPAAGRQLPCRRHDPNLFFAESPADVERAKTICQPCPVRTACLGAAIERREPWGVWGGELFIDGVVVPRKRPRGRPRKQDSAPAAAASPAAGATPAGATPAGTKEAAA